MPLLGLQSAPLVGLSLGDILEHVHLGLLFIGDGMSSWMGSLDVQAAEDVILSQRRARPAADRRLQVGRRCLAGAQWGRASGHHHMVVREKTSKKNRHEKNRHSESGGGVRAHAYVVGFVTGIDCEPVVLPRVPYVSTAKWLDEKTYITRGAPFGGHSHGKGMREGYLALP